MRVIRRLQVLNEFRKGLIKLRVKWRATSVVLRNARPPVTGSRR